MMRIFSIIAIVASVILVIGTVGFIHVVASDRSAASYEMISSYSSGSDYGSSSNSMYDSYEDEAASYTKLGAIFSLGILVFLETVLLFSLLKIKTKTMKVISIIGMSLCGILILFSFAPISSPSGCSFDEVGALYTIFGIFAIAFFMIGTIHAFRVKA